jgi:hypothetical protein
MKRRAEWQLHVYLCSEKEMSSSNPLADLHLYSPLLDLCYIVSRNIHVSHTFPQYLTSVHLWQRDLC